MLVRKIKTKERDLTAMEKEYAYFSHKKCEYFPCHPAADPDNFNCLFCFCPLYVLGRACGGNFRYLPNGRKDCSRCLFPHLRENYGAVTGRYQEILSAANELENIREYSRCPNFDSKERKVEK